MRLLRVGDVGAERPVVSTGTPEGAAQRQTCVAAPERVVAG
jgi:hypothetical protein